MNAVVTPLIRAVDRLGLYFRAARNDHREILNLLASGPPAFTGVVLDASHEDRQGDLRQELARRRLEAVLDPMTMELATPGGWERAGLRGLPWAGVALHAPSAFSTVDGLADPIAAFAFEKNYGAVLSPTHYIGGVDDPWFRIDLAACGRLRAQLDAAARRDVPIYYRLAIPRRALTEPNHRRAIVSRLADLEIDAVWLSLHPVEADASANVLMSYIDLCRDFAKAGLPLVAEHTGFVGLALLGFNAVAGIESGITLGERFNMNNLIHPPKRKDDGRPFARSPRVYIDRLGVFLVPDEAKKFMAAPGIRRRFACQDQPCCRQPEDMIEQPRRHFLHARAQQVTEIARVPSHLRPTVHLDTIRRASDDATQAARINKRFEQEQRRLGEWRQALATYVQTNDCATSTVTLASGRLRRRKSA
jgi:hypothetical protein